MRPPHSGFVQVRLEETRPRFLEAGVSLIILVRAGLVVNWAAINIYGVPHSSGTAALFAGRRKVRPLTRQQIPNRVAAYPRDNRVRHL